MVNKVYLAVCDNCDTVSNEPGKCIECMGDMQVVTFVRQASQLTPVAPDLRHAPDDPGNYSKKSNSSNGASR